ncbi:MAG: TonB-dependent receptor plug domain-containing protein, partial [Brevundimonas sp.]
MSVRRSLAQSGNTQMEVATFVGFTVGKQRQTRLGSFSRIPQRTYVQGSEKMRSTRVRLSVSISALALSLSAWGGMAQAQTASSQDAATEVEEIIVTARRRAETLDQIPASADVVLGEQLDTRGVDSGKDLTRQVAGLQVIDNGTGVSDEFVIRGEGNTRQNNAESGSGLYRDGIFVPGGNIGGRNYVAADFFDIDRVEILKGPQGSYFGRNALGGAVNILTARP